LAGKKHLCLVAYWKPPPAIASTSKLAWLQVIEILSAGTPE